MMYYISKLPNRVISPSFKHSLNILFSFFLEQRKAMQGDVWFMPYKTLNSCFISFLFFILFYFIFIFLNSCFISLSVHNLLPFSNCRSSVLCMCHKPAPQILIVQSSVSYSSTNPNTFIHQTLTDYLGNLHLQKNWILSCGKKKKNYFVEFTY